MVHTKKTGNLSHLLFCLCIEYPAILLSMPCTPIEGMCGRQQGTCPFPPETS